MEMSRLTTSGNAVSAAISPDGKFLAYAVSDGGKQSFRIRQIANGSEVQVSAPSDAEYRGPVFSPDGNLVYYNTGVAELYKVPTLGGVPALVSKNIVRHSRLFARRKTDSILPPISGSQRVRDPCCQCGRNG